MGPALRVRGLAKRYPGFALSDVSFDVPPGHVMGLVGPNGAGKTTTLKAILGLVRPDAGEIRIEGLDPWTDGESARSRVGFVHDEPRFHRHLSLRTTARLIAGFYRDWDERTFRELAETFGLRLDRRFGTLSRGTRMKFALALALAHRAHLIVLDEPTSGLDPVFRRELLDVLLEQVHDVGASVLFSTHLTADLDRIADYVTLLQNGRVLLSDAKDDILESWGVVKGGHDVLSDGSRGWLRGVRKGTHGFEAITDDAAAVRSTLGDRVIVERPTLEDIVLLTSRGDQDV
jgi:ABC-2 type transport system ATP-binding protein